MLAINTQSDTGTLLWAPSREKLAYVTQAGLQVYISDPHSEDERFVTLSGNTIVEMNWSSNSCYLAVRTPQETWTIYRFVGLQVQPIYHMTATSLDWVDTDTIIYIPLAGGLVIVHLGRPDRAIHLAG